MDFDLIYCVTLLLLPVPHVCVVDLIYDHDSHYVGWLVIGYVGYDYGRLRLILRVVVTLFTLRLRALFVVPVGPHTACTLLDVVGSYPFTVVDVVGLICDQRSFGVYLRLIYGWLVAVLASPVVITLRFGWVVAITFPDLRTVAVRSRLRCSR